MKKSSLHLEEGRSSLTDMNYAKDKILAVILRLRCELAKGRKAFF